MSRFEEIKYESHEFLNIKNITWFSEATNHRGLAKGGIYLLSGYTSDLYFFRK